MKEQDKEQEQQLDDGQLCLEGKGINQRIHLLNIIGEIEGHECLPSTTKTTKYEHVLPKLAQIQDDQTIKGVLVLLNTVGGDVEAGLAIAEMIASLSKPVVTLVLGGGHSIGVPLAVSGDYSYIAPTATMVVHPIRMTGMMIGVKQNYAYIEQMQNRIIDFTVQHSKITQENMRSMMMNNQQLVKDIGTMLVGKEAVDCGLIHEVGGIQQALQRLYAYIDEE